MNKNKIQVVLIQHLEYPSSTIVTGMTSAVFLFPVLHSGVEILSLLPFASRRFT